jgi:polar amino acid transport system substrate-binding protein
MNVSILSINTNKELSMTRVRNKRFLSIIAGVLLLSVMPLAFSAGEAESAAETISFAGSGGYPPFNYITDSGDVIGFDVDVAQEIATRMDMELDYVTTSWDGIIEGLRAKRYDGILGSMGITPERQERVNFTNPYYYSGPQLIVHKESGISGPEDLGASHKIGLATGTTFEEDAKKLGVEVKLYEDDTQTLLELINGRIDGVLTDRIVGLNAISNINGGDQLELVGSVLRSEKMGIALHKDDADLLEEVNSILADMREDGTLTEISGRWFNGQDITRE